MSDKFFFLNLAREVEIMSLKRGMFRKELIFKMDLNANCVS